MDLSKHLSDLLHLPERMARRAFYDFGPGQQDETACTFVSSRGIAKHCRALVDLRQTQTAQIVPSRLDGIEADAALYLYTANIREFAETYLPKIRTPFRLVSGADDLSASSAGLGEATVAALLGNPLVTRWFAQNAEMTHPKLTPIPIGIDYHTLTGNHDRPWRAFETPLAQERDLLAVRAAAPAVADRACSAYSNWHFFLARGDRQECCDRIDHSCVYFEPSFVSRRESWTTNTRHLFTISPLGNGLDCHRTWEALALGTIPIVHRSPLDDLYEGLPVCIVDDWAEVTPDFLRQRREQMLARTFDFSRVYQAYWRDLVQRDAAGTTTVMSLQQFTQSAVAEQS